MTVEQFYFFLGGAVLVLAVMMLWISIIMPGTSRWNKRFITTIFVVFVLFILSCIIDLLVYADPDMVLAERLVSYFEYLLPTIPMPMFTAYLLNTCASADWRKSPLFRTVIFLWGLYFLLLGIAQGTTVFYSITPDNLYVQGPWHPFLIVPVMAIMLLNLAGVIQRRNQLSRKYYTAFLLHLLPITAVVFVQMIAYYELILVLAMCISMLSMFVIILYDQIERYVQGQREIAHQRASIMVLEMRPHFIYNAMMSIYYLCAQDAKKAQQVTLDFTTYLRKNFTAIAGEDTIPFDDELEHTRAYLAIEQVQFGDRLCVDYDTPHTNFRLPPLTLQPLVENAVKHGMDPEAEPLHISIRTRETRDGSELIVEDDGPGFDGSEMNLNEPHIALANIRQRLSMMCNGKMKIRPREGGGTIVQVIIP